MVELQKLPFGAVLNIEKRCDSWDLRHWIFLFYTTYSSNFIFPTEMSPASCIRWSSTNGGDRRREEQEERQAHTFGSGVFSTKSCTKNQT